MGRLAAMGFTHMTVIYDGAPRSPFPRSFGRSPSSPHSCEDDGWCQYVHPQDADARGSDEPGVCAWGSTYGRLGAVHVVRGEECCTFG